MDQVLKTRTITGIIFGVVLIGMLLLGKLGMFLLVSVVSTIGAYEYCQMTGKSNTSSLIGGIIALVPIFCSYYFEFSNETKFIYLGICISIYLTFIVNLFRKNTLNHNKVLPLFTFIYPALPLVSPLLFSNDKMWQNKLWMYVMFLIWISDSGAYLVGRKLGKTKLFERISPKKTWEGFLGATVFTIIGSYIIFSLTSTYSLAFWLSSALFICIIGVLGDLYESSLKRKYNIKDSGNLLPGHGGFLDRFDSFIFVLPFMVLILKLFKF
jgi:phosphatidate cytidylyltransferase